MNIAKFLKYACPHERVKRKLGFNAKLASTYYKNKTFRKRNCLNKKENIYMFRNQFVFNTATFNCNCSNGYQKQDYLLFTSFS